MRVLTHRASSHFMLLVTIIAFSYGCRRYPAQNSTPTEHTPTGEELGPEDNKSTLIANKQGAEDTEKTLTTTVIEKARRALSSASASLTETEKKAPHKKIAAHPWTCTTESSPVVMYNAEHNQLVYCQKGNWQLVPLKKNRVKVGKTQKNKPQKQKAKVYQTSGEKICGNGKCRPRTAEDAPAEEKDEFACRRTGEQSYVCRGR